MIIKKQETKIVITICNFFFEHNFSTHKNKHFSQLKTKALFNKKLLDFRRKLSKVGKIKHLFFCN